jgi:E3 ubiquitin-protein ligase MYCBP2
MPDFSESFIAKARRQAKALKALRPKKLSKLEGKVVVQAACNSGTSAAVTKDGQLFMFGKDATHCDPSGDSLPHFGPSK